MSKTIPGFGIPLETAAKWSHTPPAKQEIKPDTKVKKIKIVRPKKVVKKPAKKSTRKLPWH